MSNTNTTKVTFNVGSIVHVWEPKGCRELKGGASSSERLGGEYPDIDTTEDLKVIKKLGSTRAIVERSHEDCKGMQISMHLNHINADSSYYALRGQRSQSQKPLAQRKAEVMKKLEETKKELAELIAAQAEAEQELKQELDTQEEVSDESRDEAKALFEQAVGS